MLNIPDILGIGLPFLSGALGVGVAYGILKSQLVEHDRRITNLENRSCGYLTEAHHSVLQKACRDGLKEDIEEIKTEMRDQRKFLNTRLDIISTFMGRMEGSKNAE